MPEEVILFQTKISGRLSEKRTAIPSAALLIVLLLSVFFLSLFLKAGYLNACIIAVISVLIAWPVITLIRQKTHRYTLQLTTEALYGIDRQGNKDILVQLRAVRDFRYYSLSFDPDDYRRVLQANTIQGPINLPLSALTRSREKELLLSLSRAGFTVFLVYENQELGNTYPGI